jgi:hypothetical protein
VLYDASAASNRKAEIWRVLSERAARRWVFRGTAGNASGYVVGEWQFESGGGLVPIWTGTSTLGPCARLRTSSASSRAFVSLARQDGTNFPVQFGGGEWRATWRVKLPASASDGTDTYEINPGFGPGSGNARSSGSDRCCFAYTHSANAGKWEARTQKTSGGSTTEDTGVAFSANAEITMAIHVTNTTSAKFYINGTLTNTITTNIPTLADVITIDVGQERSAGTNVRDLLVALVELIFIPSTAW